MTAESLIVEQLQAVIARQQHSKHVPAATDTEATIQQLTMDKIYYSTEKTNPSSYRRGGRLPNCVRVKFENKNMVTGPNGALHQE
jgi:hypothetical protein